LSFFIVLHSARGENWPSWRGPDNNGISRATGLPTTWSADKNILWKLPLPGKGGSTPVIWGDRIFLTAGANKDLWLLCVATDGKQLWQRKIGSAGRAAIRGDEGNEASASPSTDGKLVYVFVGSGDCACFDFDGNEVWKFNAQQRYGAFRIQHGMHSTPLLHEDRLYLTMLHSGSHWIVALDKATGKEVWKVDRQTDARDESKEAYTSPCLWHNGKEPCLIVGGCDYATAHRLINGAEIWRLADLNPKNRYSTALRIIASPVASTDLLVVPTARGGLIVGVKPGASGLISPGGEFEQWRKAKGAPDVPSPLIHGGLVYLCQADGVLLCLDAKTGEERYRKRLHDSRYRASPVYADGKVYLTARDGTFHVVKDGPMFEVVAVNSLPDEFTASPVISSGRIYFRGFRQLYAIQDNSKGVDPAQRNCEELPAPVD
jgi:outer membrane protein assembly factor BamB